MRRREDGIGVRSLSLLFRPSPGRKGEKEQEGGGDGERGG